jgi:hypothetical protein
MNGSINITLPVLRMVPPAPAQSYMVAARGLYSGVKVLASNPGATATACAFLAAQTLECALKSYLSHAGIPQKKLKCRPLRHNLENLWIEAVNKGLNVQAQAPQWCLILNSAHDEPYYFRYPMGLNVTTLPALVPMASELEMVLAVVEKSI